MVFMIYFILYNQGKILNLLLNYFFSKDFLFGFGKVWLYVFIVYMYLKRKFYVAFKLQVKWIWLIE